MYKVAVVGPAVSVERILSVAQDFTSQLTFQPFIYETAIETIEIVKEQHPHFDFFLFSGPIPYDLAKRTIHDHSKLFYIHLLETGFYKALLDLTHHVQKPIEHLSIDIVDTSNVVDISLDQLKIPVETIYVKEFDASINYRLLFEHHARLWEDGKIEGVLTCYPEVMALLNEKGIPTEWISTTKLATRQVLEVIEQTAAISYFKGAQIGVCFIDVDTKIYDQTIPQLSYDIQFATLKMNEELLRLSREMNGSFFSFHDGNYMIFSSRGEIMHTMPLLHETVERLERAWNRSIHAGIGFGDSALRAEMHARRAVQQSSELKNEIVILDNDGERIYAWSDGHSPPSISNNEEILNRLKEEGINLLTYERVHELIRRKKWTTFTAKDVAVELNMSNRNAQRLLLALTKASLLEQSGEEKSVSKGRPSKLYRLITQ